MYFAYGFPKTFRLGSLPFPGGEREEVVFASFGGSSHQELLLIVTSIRLQIWSGGKDRIKLGEYLRSRKALEREGLAAAATWSPSKRRIAVATEKGHVLLYGIAPSNSMFEIETMKRISIYLQNSSTIPNLDVNEAGRQYPSDAEGVVPDGMSADGNTVLVALTSGVVFVFSWSGELLGRDLLLARLFHPKMYEDEHARSHDLMLTLQRLPLAVRDSLGIASLHYVSSERTMAVTTQDGGVIVLILSENGHFLELDEASFRLVYRPSSPKEHRAISAALHPNSHMLVVGLEHGRIQLYNMADVARRSASHSSSSAWFETSHQELQGDSYEKRLSYTRSDVPKPLRVLSLSDWGYGSAALGGARFLRWSPDGQVIAVGYGHGGVAVWTPSGCRVMCTLRQAAALDGDEIKAGLAVECDADNYDTNFEYQLNNRGARWDDGLGPLANRKVGILEYPVAALAWSQQGYSLLQAEISQDNKETSGCIFNEIQFAQYPRGCHRVLEAPTSLSLERELPQQGLKAKGAHWSSGLLSSYEDLLAHKSSRSGGMNNIEDDYYVLQACDRILIVTKTLPTISAALQSGLLQPAEAEAALKHNPGFSVHSLRMPQEYIDSAFPLLHVAVSFDRQSIAVAGTQGLAVCHPAQAKWRLFGDALQERETKVHMLKWLPHDVVFVVGMIDVESLKKKPAQSLTNASDRMRDARGTPQEEKRAPTIVMYPSDHLDASSILGKYSLPNLPCAVDTIGPYIAMASAPLDILILRSDFSFTASLDGSQRGSSNLSRTSGAGTSIASPRGQELTDVSLSVIRQLSLMSLSGPPKELSLLAPPLRRSLSRSDLGLESGSDRRSSQHVSSSATVSNDNDGIVPQHCVFLRHGGLLSVLDLKKGVEFVVSEEIESYWLPASPGAPPVLDLSELSHGKKDDDSSTSAYHRSREDEENGLRTTDAALDVFVGQEALPSPAAKGAAWLERRVSDGSAVAAAVGDLEDVLAELRKKEGAGLEKPWWSYGPQGMQLWFPSTIAEQVEECGGHNRRTMIHDEKAALLSEGTDRIMVDPELEFDKEVFPIGISLTDVSVVGVMHRTVRNNSLPPATAMAVSFHPHPESQPVLPCLLRRLLEHGQAADAVELATRHSKDAHFAKSLEWLLFTALDTNNGHRSVHRGDRRSSWAPRESSVRASFDHAVADMARQDSIKDSHSHEAHGLPTSIHVDQRSLLEPVSAPPKPSMFHDAMITSPSKKDEISPLLVAAVRLVQQFPLASEIVISVARKTDVSLWPSLFAAAGPPSELAEDLLSSGALQTAACCLVIVEKLQGAPVAQTLALQLVKSALSAAEYGLAVDVLKFLVPPGEGDLSRVTYRESKLGEGRSDAPRKGRERNEVEPEIAGPSTEEAEVSSSKGFFSTLWDYFSGEDVAARMEAEAKSTDARSSGESSSNPQHLPRTHWDTSKSPATYANPSQEITAALHKAVSSASLNNSLGDTLEVVSSSNVNHSATGSYDAGGIAVAGIAAWHGMGRHAWKLLDSGGLRELAEFCKKMLDVHGGLASLLLTTANDVASSFPGGNAKRMPAEVLQKGPNAASVASALFVISNEFASVLEGNVETFVAAKQLCEALKKARCINYAIALSLFLGDASDMEEYSVEYPEMWPALVELVSNDVHLCAFTGIVSPPGTPLMQEQR